MTATTMPAKNTTGQTVSVTLDGRNVTLALRRSSRARRIAIRVDPALGGGELVLPANVSISAGRAFVIQRAAWLLERLDQIPALIPFQAGASIPYRGAPHCIVHDPSARRGVHLADNRIVVSGRPEHLARRLRDWLRREALAAIAPLVGTKATMLARTHGRISIRNQKSRWGSCSANGNLSFNWRLILAPDDVLDYVVAHEVGHLAQANHSPAFWAVVDGLTPHAREGRGWLKQHGGALFRYG
jgi:predicted metal-dependent hydrolase